MTLKMTDACLKEVVSSNYYSIELGGEAYTVSLDIANAVGCQYD